MILYLTHISITRKKLMWALAGLFALTVLVYGYLVNATIMNIVERKEAAQEIAFMRSSIGGLESQYNVLRNTLTYEYAKALGFSESREKIFIVSKQIVQNSPFSSFTKEDVLVSQ